MTLFFLFITMIGAFFADILFQGHWIFAVVPALTVCMACYWFWRLGLNMRLFLAFAVGFVLDSIHLFSFGTYLLLLGALAFAVEWMKMLLSRSESHATDGMRVAFLIILFRLLVTPMSFIIKTIL